MQAEHVVAKCTWNSVFDDETRAVELQNFISHWSNKVLIEELNEFFAQTCPVSQTWRIDELNLNLGTISIHNLAEELPLRLRNSLKEAFSEVLAKETGGFSLVGIKTMHKISETTVMLDYIKWFLQTGCNPWWFRSNSAFSKIFNDQINANPTQLEHLIRTEGKAETVRKRLVWQLRDEQIKKVIKVLEPWHGGFICEYADNVITIMEGSDKVVQQKNRLRMDVWLVILETILIDRGTIFNTVQFVAGTLKRLAMQYNIEYTSLLNILSLAIGKTGVDRAGNAKFVVAVKMLQEQENKNKSSCSHSNIKNVDYWQVFHELFKTSRLESGVGFDKININEVFVSLLNKNKSRMRDMVLRLCTGDMLDSVELFQPNEFMLLLDLIVSSNHEYVRYYYKYVDAVLKKYSRAQPGWRRILVKSLMASKHSTDLRKLTGDSVELLIRNVDVSAEVLFDRLLFAEPDEKNNTYLTVINYIRMISDRHETSRSKNYIVSKTAGPRTEQHDRKITDIDQRGVTASITNSYDDNESMASRNWPASIVSNKNDQIRNRLPPKNYQLLPIKDMGPAEFSRVLDELSGVRSEFLYDLLRCLTIRSSSAWTDERGHTPLKHDWHGFLLDILLILRSNAINAANVSDSEFVSRFWRQFKLTYCEVYNENPEKLERDILSIINMQRDLTVNGKLGQFGKGFCQSILKTVEQNNKQENIANKQLSLLSAQDLLKLLDICCSASNSLRDATIISDSIVMQEVDLTKRVDLVLTALINKHPEEFKVWFLDNIVDPMVRTRLKSYSYLKYIDDLFCQFAYKTCNTLHARALRRNGNHSDNTVSNIIDGTIEAPGKDLAEILACLSSDTSQQIQLLYSALCSWIKKGKIPALNNISISLWFIASLKSMLQYSNTINHSLFVVLNHLMLQINKMGIDAGLIIKQIKYSVLEHKSNSGFTRDLIYLLERRHKTQLLQFESIEEKNKIKVIAGTTHWTFDNLISQAFKALEMKDMVIVTDDDFSADVNVDINVIWNILNNKYNAVLRQWLKLHPYKSVIIRNLLRMFNKPAIHSWFKSMLPKSFNKYESYLAAHSEFIISSGLWSGSVKKIEQTVSDLFWQMMFECDQREVRAREFIAKHISLTMFFLNIDIYELASHVREKPVTRSGSGWDVVILNAFAEFKNRNGWVGTQKVSNKAGSLSNKPQMFVETRKSDRLTMLSQDFYLDYLEHDGFVQKARDLIFNSRTGNEGQRYSIVNMSRMLHDLLVFKPELAPKVLYGIKPNTSDMLRLLRAIRFEWVLFAFDKTKLSGTHLLKFMRQFYDFISNKTLERMPAKYMSDVFLQLIITNWIDKRLAGLTESALTTEFFSDLIRRYNVNLNILKKEFLNIGSVAQAVRQVCDSVLTELTDNLEKHNTADALHRRLIEHQKNRPDYSKAQKMETPYTVNNAGLVVLQGYINPLFERVGLVSEGKFISIESQRRAVHVLQYLATGHCGTEEQHLVLNKIICGLDLYVPVEYSIGITEYEQDTCHSLIGSVIDYWSVLGKSSIDGFRGNWLVRDGTLTESKDHWDLIVDKRAYDILLGKSPLSYSVIKMPWMQKPIYVTWPT